MKIVEWQEAYGPEVVAWHYEPPYDFYDLASDPEDAGAMSDPAQAQHRRAMLGDDGSLEAFLWFDWHDEVVEVGIGLRPDLTGRGLGEAFFQAQLDYASEQWHPEAFRLFVAAWNERAIRLYERLGFHEVRRETRHFELVGDHEFIQMEQAA